MCGLRRETRQKLEEKISCRIDQTPWRVSAPQHTGTSWLFYGLLIDEPVHLPRGRGGDRRRVGVGGEAARSPGPGAGPGRGTSRHRPSPPRSRAAEAEPCAAPSPPGCASWLLTKGCECLDHITEPLPGTNNSTRQPFTALLFFPAGPARSALESIPILRNNSLNVSFFSTSWNKHPYISG